jgi:hypothetical protein
MDSNNISTLLEQAIAMKNAEINSNAKVYLSKPLYHQHSIFSNDKLDEIRNMCNFYASIKYAEECKQKGTEYCECIDNENDTMVNENNLFNAIHEFEKALSVFNWIEPNDKVNWKNQAIEDSNITYHTYNPIKNEEKYKIQELNIYCFIYLALCYQKLNQWKNSIDACNSVLDLDSENYKALFLRAQARYIPVSCDRSDNELALVDLSTAMKISPNDSEITAAYNELKESLKDQKTAEKKAFKAAFSSVNYSDLDDRSKINKSQDMTFSEALKYINDLKSTADRQEREGKYDFAEETRKKINKIEQQVRSEKDKIQHINQMDQLPFENPTQDMIDEASKFGIDLSDPKIREMMVELRNESVKLNDDDTDNSRSEEVVNNAVHNVQKKSLLKLVNRILEETSTEDMRSMMNIRYSDRPNMAQKIVTFNEKDLKENLISTMMCDIEAINEAQSHVNNKRSDELIAQEIMKSLLDLYGNGVDFGKLRKNDNNSLGTTIGIIAAVLYFFYRLYQQFTAVTNPSSNNDGDYNSMNNQWDSNKNDDEFDL